MRQKSPAWAATVELGTLQLVAETPPITLAVAAMGVFYGGMVSSDVGVFAPINTAVAGRPGSSAVSDQTNNAAMLQGATQIGGVGGAGGSHNAAIDGSGGGHTFTGDMRGTAAAVYSSGAWLT